MERLTTISLHMQALKFSAAHFTIFSAIKRERLHGHNFAVQVNITAPVGDDGLTCDYAIFKRKSIALVDALDEYTIIPSKSPYLEISDEKQKQGTYHHINFNGEVLLLLQSDTLLLPIANTTVEEFSHYILLSLCEDQALLDTYDIREIEVSVASGPGQSGSSRWQRSRLTSI